MCRCGFTSAFFGTDRYQGEAGRRVGIQEGEAWRTALLAAAQHGASQVVLALCKQLVIMLFAWLEHVWRAVFWQCLALCIPVHSCNFVHIIPVTS